MKAAAGLVYLAQRARHAAGTRGALALTDAARAVSAASGATQTTARGLRTAADPPVTLSFYRFQGGAPRETAQFTDMGARAFERSISPAAAEGLRLALNPGGADLPESTRDDTLDPTVGVRNFAAVKRALADHFDVTAQAILGGRVPLGIGGDHSMAAATLRATVLGVVARELVAHNAGLPLRGARQVTEPLRARFAACVARSDVQGTGALVDEAVATGALSLADLQAFKARFEVIWIDAHFDYNTPWSSADRLARVVRETGDLLHPVKVVSPSPSGNFHGMPAATAAGSGPSDVTEHVSKHLSVEPDHFGFIAVRDGDDSEQEVLRELGVVSCDMEHLRKAGLKGALQGLVLNAETRSRARTGEAPFLLVQLDIDALDALFVPRTGTPVGTGSSRNPATGPELAEMVEAVRDLIKDPRIESVDVTEVAYCPTDKAQPTLAAAQAVVSSILGLTELQRGALFPQGAR